MAAPVYISDFIQIYMDQYGTIDRARSACLDQANGNVSDADEAWYLLLRQSMLLETVAEPTWSAVINFPITLLADNRGIPIGAGIANPLALNCIINQHGMITGSNNVLTVTCIVH